jgi:uncharacterized protein YndB with AHSA1/START domain
MSAAEATVKPGEKEITITRVFDAPVERVWDAFAELDQIVKWWGPTGFTNETEKREFKEGGVWKHVMVGPDGARYINKCTYKKILKHQLVELVNGGGREGDDESRGVSFNASWKFESLGADKTRITLRSVFGSPEERDRVIKDFGAVEGGKQTLGRLAEFIAAPAWVLEISRVVNAPRARVWEAWTTPDQMKEWFAPKPFQLVIKSMDLKPGGKFSMAMRGPDGSEFPFSGTYREIVPPSKLVWTGEFTGDPVDSMRTTIVFAEEGGKTKVSARQTFAVMTPTVKHATAGAQAGWTMTLDQLAAFCEKR